MAKSELLAACWPSLPKIPTPTWALRIIETSLAPSPMARVIFLGNLFLIITTISDFCFGLTLHAKTTSILSEASKNNFFNISSVSIIVSDYPATIMACFVSGLLIVVSTILSFIVLNSLSKSISVLLSTICYFMLLSSRPVDIPIEIAVSILSPVKTQTFIPTRFMNLMVSATLSCNLSSIAVDPMSSRSYSISSFTFCNSSSLLFTTMVALTNFSFHS